MRIGVLGTGMVGTTIGTKLVDLGHEVRIGSRTAGNEKATEWVADLGEGASEGDFAAAAAHGELVFNCTAGVASLDALAAAGESNLAGKVLVDVANPLESSGEGLPTLAIANDDSLGERIQAAFPAARVVKALNTVNCRVMVDPAGVPGDHAVFVCGNDDGAKAEVTDLLGDLGWPPARIVDLGDISAARGQEMYLPLWLRMMQAFGTPQFNIAIERP
jgi:predicted dinucleotide-binding enzyme